MAFVDLEKIYDKDDWIKPFVMLISTELKYRDRRIVANIYKDQMGVSQIEGCGKEAVIGEGMKQGCSLSPLLFKLFIDYTLHNIKENCRSEIKFMVVAEICG